MEAIEEVNDARFGLKSTGQAAWISKVMVSAIAAKCAGGMKVVLGEVRSIVRNVRRVWGNAVFNPKALLLAT